jgi:hypothetical protein
MGSENLQEDGIHFLTALFDRVEGNPDAKASMYEIGEKIGVDRDVAARTAEMLIGGEWVEIKTLSGAIGITQRGIEEIQSRRREAEGETKDAVALSGAAVLKPVELQAIEEMILHIKNNLTAWALPFEELSGLVADVKTMEIQITSPAPKSAIIRECLHSICDWIEKKDAAGLIRRINALLGE